MPRLPVLKWSSFVLAASLIGGCYMRVKIDSGADSPFGDLRASVVAYSARGEGFDERKEKDVYISIYRRGTEPPEYLLKKDFKITAAELNWDIKWTSADEVMVDLFEYPPGVSRWSDAAVNRKVPTIHLKTMVFIRAPGERAFHEKEN
jgi:hypothetical protein